MTQPERDVRLGRADTLTPTGPGPVPARPAFWEDVLARGGAVPATRRLDDMTVELVEMLGDPDPHVRDALALRILCAWVADGVYDDLLPALGDGITEGFRPGLGEDGTFSVLRRSFSARVLAAVIDRDNVLRGMHREAVLRWGDRGLSWMLAERDLRGQVPGVGRAEALVHAADLLRALALSRHLQAEGLGVLLQAMAERLTEPSPHRIGGTEADHLAHAAMCVLHRDILDADTVRAWIRTLAQCWANADIARGPVPAQVRNAVDFARALHLQLLLGIRQAPNATAKPNPPVVRVEALAELQTVLRSSGPYFASEGSP